VVKWEKRERDTKMLQIKCGKCNMEHNIDEKLFDKRRVAPYAEVPEKLTCNCCGTCFPNGIIKIIHGILDTYFGKNANEDDVGDWKVRMLSSDEKIIQVNLALHNSTDLSVL